MSSTKSVAAAIQSEQAKAELAKTLASKDIFKTKTHYILIGDEPRNANGVVNLASVLSKEQVEDLKKYFTFMPRMLLWNFFKNKIWANMPSEPKAKAPGSTWTPVQRRSFYGETYMSKPDEDLIWSGIIDLFNIANLEYVTKNKIEPWKWEEEKMTAYYTSQDEEALKKLEQQAGKSLDIALERDEEAKRLMREYIALPKIADPGLEINRQNAIKELIKQKDYKTAQAAIDAFKYLNNTGIGAALQKPIPFDIKAQDGSGIVKAT